MPLFSGAKRINLGPDSDLLPSNFTQAADKDDDGSSIVSYSTMATTDSNRGAGWTLDKYFYQRSGRWIETWASRIGLRFGAIPPSIIARRLHDVLHTYYSFSLEACYSYRGTEKAVTLVFAEKDRVAIDNGIDCLLKQLQYVVTEASFVV